MEGVEEKKSSVSLTLIEGINSEPPTRMFLLFSCRLGIPALWDTSQSRGSQPEAGQLQSPLILS